jgi:hypothetical protein
MKTLRKGDQGTEVQTLQQKLTSAGYPLNPIDGKFGPDTDSAVRSFQGAKKLKVDGVVGPATWKALESAKNTSLSLKTIRKGSRDPLVRTLNETLVGLGYKIQPVDSYFGTKTDTAVRDFQRKNKLLADGVVGPVTWNALGFRDSAKPDLDPIEYFRTLLASLGLIFSQSTATSRGVAQPVAQMKTSLKGLQFIYTREAWAGRSNRLHWPGGGSGVTLGPGYDMKGRTEASIITDMTSIGLDAKTAKAIAKAAGLTGDKAKQFCKDNRKLVLLSNKREFNLMKKVIPYYEQKVKDKITVDLLPQEFDALVSFAYNLGSLWTSVANHINNGKIVAAMNRLKQANKSGGKINEGLVKRRALEVALYTMGDYGKLRIV